MSCPIYASWNLLLITRLAFVCSKGRSPDTGHQLCEGHVPRKKWNSNQNHQLQCPWSICLPHGTVPASAPGWVWSWVWKCTPLEVETWGSLRIQVTWNLISRGKGKKRIKKRKRGLKSLYFLSPEQLWLVCHMYVCVSSYMLVWVCLG